MRPEEDKKRRPVELWYALKRLFVLTKPYRVRLFGAIVLAMLASAVWLVVPLGLRELLDAVFEEGNRTLLNRLAFGLLALFFLQAIIGVAGYYLLEWTGLRVVAEFRQKLYTHLQRLGLKFYAGQRIGDLTSRLTNDVGTIREALTNALVELLTKSLSLFGSVALMVLLNWRLSLIIFVLVPVVTLSARYFGLKIRKLARTVQDRLADTTAIAEEALSAIRLVKAFAREPYEVKRYNAAVEDLFGIERYRMIITQIFWWSIGMLFLSALIAIFWYGGSEVLAGRLTAGDLVAFIFYAFNIAQSVGGLARLYATFNSAAGASERLFELLDSTPEIQDSPKAFAVPTLRGRVDIEQISFAYEPSKPVLRDITLTVEAGETVALVGPSGTGKTTLLNLIPRFYDVTNGSIRVDGYDVRDVQVASLRQQIAIVQQEVHLFGTTIGDNIRYGKLDASDDEVEEAARAANAHGFIMDMPEGYATTIGERGVKLSGGQRQRIAIARAILRDARILLLDEATSSLDSVSEQLVQEALEHLMQNRTTFIIAHRLATVQDADRIFVMEGGRVVQTGTHTLLMDQEGLYRELAARQFRDTVTSPL